MAFRRSIARLSCALALLGCGAPGAGHDAGPVPAAEPEPAAAEVAPAPASPETIERAPVEAPEADQVVRFEAGSFRAGSRPGLPHRRPSVEADLVTVELPAFDVDRLPYPNDPERPPLLVGTRREAARLCEERGRRLCDELEWERACRGDEGTSSFPTGEAFDLDTCLGDVTACASPDGVLDLGVRAPEWTSSDAGERLAVLERTAVVRGGRPDSSPASHRCGTRHVVDPAGGGRARAFRCCGGEAPEVAYPDVGMRRMFRDLELTDARWREILGSVEQTADLAEGFAAAGESDAIRALARGGAGVDDMHWELTTRPFAWSPSPGEEVWVVSGSSGERSALIVLYPTPDQTFLHAATFVVDEPESSFAILRDPATRGELLWSTCWSCGGENGVIRFDEDATIVIVQQ